MTSNIFCNGNKPMIVLIDSTISFLEYINLTIMSQFLCQVYHLYIRFNITVCIAIISPKPSFLYHRSFYIMQFLLYDHIFVSVYPNQLQYCITESVSSKIIDFGSSCVYSCIFLIFHFVTVPS